MNQSNSGMLSTTPYVMYLQVSSDVSSKSINESATTSEPPAAPISEPPAAPISEPPAAPISEPPAGSTSEPPATSSSEPPADMPNSRGICELSNEELMELIPEAMLQYWPTMSEKDKNEVKDMLSNMKYLKQQCDALENQKKTYKGDIGIFKKMKTDLEKKKEDLHQQILMNREQQDILKQLLQDNEADLAAYRKEVKKQLRLKKETDTLKTNVYEMKKDIKEINRKIIKQHVKINTKVPQEKELHDKFSSGLSLLKDFRDIIEKHGLMPQKKIDVLNENITEMQFDLALHEDDADKIEQHNQEFEEMFPDKN